MYRKKDFFHSLILNSSDIITILSIDGTVLFESPSVNRLLGYGQDELIGKNAFEMVHPEDLPRVQNAFAEVVRRRDLTLSAEFRFLHKDGSWRVLSATGSNQLDNPLISGIVVNSRDITERKRTEEKLRQSEERFRRIFEYSPLGMVVVARDFRLLKANRAFCDMLGYSEEEIVGRNMREFSHPEDEERSAEAAERALSGETSLWHLEKRYIKKNQESLWAEVVATTVPDKERPYALGMVKDISERKTADQEREQLVSQLQEALSKIKTLKGLIPICAWCKNVRDDEGFWRKVETYIGEHSDASFTHCICPTCLKKADPSSYQELFGNAENAHDPKSMREHRNSERLRLKKPVNIALKVESGKSGKVVINAVLEEIGDSGMCVRTDIPLEFNSLLFSSSGIEDTIGVVRWRKPAAAGAVDYLVGIQFVKD